jgi:anti-sigma factor RsiW
MSPHGTIERLLALSAAGLLDPAEERSVREHVRECPACAARLESLGSITAAVAALPSPAPPLDLTLRTQALLAAELAALADRRQGVLLALAGAGLGWISWLALWSAYRVLAGGIDNLFHFAWPSLWVWLAVSTAMAFVAAPLAAALHKARMAEGRML